MRIIPAIDIIDNKAVRLFQGDYNQKEVVGEEVLDIAKMFYTAGAECIHIVDLDGARLGRLVNTQSIIGIKKMFNIPLEVGGGIRNYDDIKKLIDNGIDKVILGTAAIDDFQFLKKVVCEFKEHIAVGIDCKDGYLYGKGWIEKSSINYLSFARDLEKIGVKNIIVTDISKDGTLEGTNLDIIRKLKEITNIDITASGGVKDIKDIYDLIDLDIYGAIVGKAIYSRTLNLKEAIRISKGGDFNAY